MGLKRQMHVFHLFLERGFYSLSEIKKNPFLESETLNPQHGVDFAALVAVYLIHLVYY